MYSSFIYHLLFVFVLFCFVITLNFDRKLKDVFLFFVFLFLLFFGGLRGNFTTDYMSYVQIFDFCARSDLDTIMHSPLDKGFAFLNYCVGCFTNEREIFFLFVMLLILIPFYQFARKSSSPFFYVMMYLTIGSYFASFNVMREVLAASVFCVGFRFIERKNIVGFLLILLLATLIHVSSILLLPFYFMLPMKLDKKLLFIIVPFMLGLFVFCNQIFFFFDNLFYENKFQENEFLIGGQTLKTLVLPCFIALFSIVVFFDKDENKTAVVKHDVESNICFNSTLYWIFFYLLSLKMPILIRYTYFFTPFVVLFVVKSFKNVNVEKKNIVYSALFFFFIIAYFVYGQYYETYFFWWEK